jgi:tetrahydromethanopterin S-methyltransferase subunit G
VLEALTLTQAHRSGAEVSDRIEEFERKVQLLLEEKGQKIGGMAGLQQIITLKSYVKELSQMVNTYKKR